jgi:hypothetical protein
MSNYARRMAEPAFFLRVKEIFEKCRERKEPDRKVFNFF